ncbi:MAG: multidrug effflux MFS transporter [Rickettsiaceae bacterium]|nr:multidrug effflux MFS transporter [Rickettsiaceae bacterium]
MNKFSFILVVSLLTGAVEVDLSVPSFPDISDYFSISDTLTQMTIAVNFLGFCLSSAFYGPISDSYGRRRVMIVGNGIMLVGALGCVVADSIGVLLFFRFIQGVGASASAVVAFAMISDIYCVEKSTKIIGAMNSLITVFMSIAPVAGGVINEYAGWRGNYIVIAVISVISWLMLFVWLPETREERNKFSHRAIMKDFKTLLSNGKFLVASTVPSLYFSGWMSFVACGSFIYIEEFGLHIMHYVVHQAIIIFTFSLASLCAGQILQNIGEKRCILLGVVFTILGSLLMIAASSVLQKSPYLTSFSMMMYGIGAAVSYPVIFSKSLEIFPEIKGTASSVIMAMRSLICATSVAISSYFYVGELISVATILLSISALITMLSISLLKTLAFDTKNLSLI